jgi:hypothetical protein
MDPDFKESRAQKIRNKDALRTLALAKYNTFNAQRTSLRYIVQNSLGQKCLRLIYSFLSTPYYIGQAFDVLDSVNIYSEARVIKVNPASQTLEITYEYWSDLWNETIPFGSPRLQPRYSHVYKHNSPEIGQRLEVIDKTNTWRAAWIFGMEDEFMLIHYKGDYRGCKPDYDKIFCENNSRFRQYGRHNTRKEMMWKRLKNELLYGDS